MGAIGFSPEDACSILTGKTKTAIRLSRFLLSCVSARQAIEMGLHSGAEFAASASSGFYPYL